MPRGWRELASVIRFNLLKLKTYSKKAIGSETIQPISCMCRFFVLPLLQNKQDMTFDDITGMVAASYLTRALLTTMVLSIILVNYKTYGYG